MWPFYSSTGNMLSLLGCSALVHAIVNEKDQCSIKLHLIFRAS